MNALLKWKKDVVADKNTNQMSMSVDFSKSVCFISWYMAISIVNCVDDYFLKELYVRLWPKLFWQSYSKYFSMLFLLSFTPRLEVAR